MDRITLNLVSLLQQIKYQELPSEVIQKGKICLLDFFGVCIAGSQDRESFMAKKFVKRLKAAPETQIIGSMVRTDRYHASFANGISAHCLELDDGNRFAQGHPGAVIIPSCLAAAEVKHISGKRLIEGIIAGYEIFGRVGKAVNPSHYMKGFHTTGTVGTIAASAATARLCNLSYKKFLNALGISTSMAAGLREYREEGAMTKQLQVGLAAKNGLLATSLAEGGFTGPKTALEGESGFLNVYSEPSLIALTQRLDKNYQIMETYFKFYQCCRHTHPAIDAILEIRKSGHFKLDEIDEVKVITYSIASKYDNRHPETKLAAKLSLPFTVALALLKGKVGVEKFSEENLRSANILKLAEKIIIYSDSYFDSLLPQKRGARVEIKTKEGKKLEKQVNSARGEPENLCENDLREKFFSLCSNFMPKNKAAQLQHNVENMEHVEDVAEFMELLLMK